MATQLSTTHTNDDNVIFTAGESEVQRLDTQHKVVAASMTPSILAPIDFSKPGLRILDQATGSGIFLRDLRASTPNPTSHTWIGTDIETSYFPTSSPPDTSYHFQSMTTPWPQSWTSSFDLVHSRFALPGVGTTSLHSAVNNLIALVKPGGWIQFVEMDLENWVGGPATQEFCAATRTLLSFVSAGQGVDLRSKLVPMMKEAGLVDIQVRGFAILTGKRAREDVRALSEDSMKATAQGVCGSLAAMLPGEGDWKGVAERLVKENGEVGSEFRVFAVWGRKVGT